MTEAFHLVIKAVITGDRRQIRKIHTLLDQVSQKEHSCLTKLLDNIS